MRRCSANIFRFGGHTLIIIILIIVVVDCRQLVLFTIDLGKAYVDLADIDILSAGIVPGPRLERLLGVGDGCCLGHVAVLHIRQGLLL